MLLCPKERHKIFYKYKKNFSIITFQVEKQHNQKKYLSIFKNN